MFSKFITIIITIQIVSCRAAVASPVPGDHHFWRAMSTQTSRTNQKIAWTLKALVVFSHYIISTNLSVAVSEKNLTNTQREQRTRAGGYEQKLISLYFLADISVFCIWIKQIKKIKRMLPCRHILCAKGLKNHIIF